MVIHTDRRSYHLRLVSTEDRYMGKVRFTYPSSEQWDGFFKAQEKLKKKAAAPRRRPVPKAIERKLDFAYVVEGKGRYKPKVVYNTGRKTIIEMPKAMKRSEAPILVGIDTKGRSKLINHRLIENRFKIDGVPDQVKLRWDENDDEVLLISRKKES